MSQQKSKPFTFPAGGKIYTLPDPLTAAKKVDGRVFRDALLDGEEGQMRMAFKLLEGGSVPKETLDALYHLPGPRMLEIVGKWMQRGDGVVSLGESGSSS